MNYRSYCCSSLTEENNRYQVFKDRVREHILFALENDDAADYDKTSVVDCIFYQTAESCHTMSPYESNLNRSISSFDAGFQQTRNDLHEIRCRILSGLTQRDLTGLEFIRAFEEAPNVIENMSIPNSIVCNDKVIDQLVNITHDMIIESPYKCTSKSRSSHRTSDVTVNHEFQFPSTPSFPRPELPSPSPLSSLPAPSPVKLKTKPSSIPLSSPKNPISSPSVTSPKSLSSKTSQRQPSEDESFSMGYQWKGEDN